jgi:AraC-like DNA-binding protein
VTTTPTTTTRDQVTSRNLLDHLKKHVPFTYALLLTSVPRGDLQVAQPTNVAEPMLRAYNEGLHAEDRLTWQAIFRNQVLTPADLWEGDGYHQSAFYQQLLQPMGLVYALAAPLASPVLDGYPGAVLLFRMQDHGEFTPADAQKLEELVRKFDEQQAQSRTGRRAGAAGPRPVLFDRPPAHLFVVDSDGRFIFPPEAEESIDPGLRNQMLEQAKRFAQTMNGHTTHADRLQLADSHGDQWPFRVVSHKHYPAFGHGAFTVLCMQPDCIEWGGVRPQDFGADPELSRLIPALKFMQQEFRRGPSLSEISGTVSLSPFHFHRRFTELLGLTPKQYMLACQIHEAKSELLAGEKELVQIAKDCGFAHQSHFTSRFKQATGLTPTRWRRLAADLAKAARD